LPDRRGRSAFLQQGARRAGVAVVPGSGFGMPGFLRLSYATSDENLRIAAERMAYALGNLT
jgi:aspartate aminotransferase